MTESEAYVAFNMCDGVGWVRLAALLAKSGGSAVRAWNESGPHLDALGRSVDWAAECALAAKRRTTIVTMADAAYPAALRDLASPPLALYVTGDPAALARPGVAVVGTRHPTVYGEDMARLFARDLARAGWSVVSGLAAGVDAVAHKAALAAKGVTVGVLGGALDKFFPPENAPLARAIVKAGGAVVSEFPFGRAPDRQTFPQRNRVVAALARGTLAVEAPRGSGTLITCDWAKKLGRAVMAVPANLDSKNSAGCWDLIRAGARCAACAEDVVAACGAACAPVAEKTAEKEALPQAAAVRNVPRREKAPEPAETPPDMALTLEEAAVLKTVPSGGVSVDMLIHRTKLPPAKVNGALVSLRLKKKLRFLPGNRVAPAAV
ncbi:MAG: DNA-processing protein DprA [Kiritimatiellae bacterium]|nr:DNA-processing protein DprA [Kiritimatiellia bacterium]